MLYSSNSQLPERPQQESYFSIGGIDPVRNPRAGSSSGSTIMHSRTNFGFHPSQTHLSGHHHQSLQPGIKCEPGSVDSFEGSGRGISSSTSAQSQSTLWANNFASLSLSSNNTNMTTSPSNSTNSSSGSSANSGSYSPSSYLYPYAGAMWRHHYESGLSRTHHAYGKKNK